MNDDFALTWRENAFGWKEAAVSRSATRRDSFYGLTCEKRMRRIRKPTPPPGKSFPVFFRSIAMHGS